MYVFAKNPKFLPYASSSVLPSPSLRVLNFLSILLTRHSTQHPLSPTGRAQTRRMYGCRRPSSDAQPTLDRFYHSPSSAYSVASSTASWKSRKPVSVARSVAGAFVSCFSPPEIDSPGTQGSGVSYEFRDRSGSFECPLFSDDFSVLRFRQIDRRSSLFCSPVVIPG